MVGVQGSQGVRDQLRRCKPGNRAHLDPLSQAVRGLGLPSVSLWELVTPAAVWTPVPGGPPDGAARARRPPRPLPLGTAWPRGARLAPAPHPCPPCRPRGPRTHTPEPPSSGPVQDARPLSVQGGRITDVGRRGARAAGGASPSEARGLDCIRGGSAARAARRPRRGAASARAAHVTGEAVLAALSSVAVTACGDLTLGTFSRCFLRGQRECPADPRRPSPPARRDASVARAPRPGPSRAFAAAHTGHWPGSRGQRSASPFQPSDQ